MVAIHQAARALQAGDCRSALVGGVNVITSPDVSESFHKHDAVQAMEPHFYKHYELTAA